MGLQKKNPSLDPLVRIIYPTTFILGSCLCTLGTPLTALKPLAMPDTISDAICDVGRLCGLVVRVPGYRSRGLGSTPDANRVSEK
jgi:hypothetical protein